MSTNFSFSFAGDDIEDEGEPNPAGAVGRPAQPPPRPASAFPVVGKPLLPPTAHSLKQMLSQLPSKIAYNLLDVYLDDGEKIQLPRRELWDVRVQLMAEDGGAGTEPGLGNHDVKTGVYEGGFKSWESSVDLVKALLSADFLTDVDVALRIIEVLQLVTLPNFILCWALHHRTGTPMLASALFSEGELELTPKVLRAFEEFLSARNISLSFFSGAWSTEFVDLVNPDRIPLAGDDLKHGTVILGAETIYSPFSLGAFTQTIFSLMAQERARGHAAEALVAAKRLYFGVGGSLDDFVAKARELGVQVVQLSEETKGVNRGVVHCSLPPRQLYATQSDASASGVAR
ncbi:hypothetical protein GGS23DRAFT_129275 [Durotheca rogersii]|uniref:uncharacterized protein n=1 Tax=Durotheca rogersii TaxID=419775 RepID=UPI00221EA0F6|nr:uncharacterized protein GGS23DRAFT_129275 [Durotheca rogersii]KAI5861735.1 hypothetical protein GGS23DRAFT_129275 [Durotheca rogersii]